MKVNDHTKFHANAAIILDARTKKQFVFFFKLNTDNHSEMGQLHAKYQVATVTVRRRSLLRILCRSPFVLVAVLVVVFGREHQCSRPSFTPGFFLFSYAFRKSLAAQRVDVILFKFWSRFFASFSIIHQRLSSSSATIIIDHHQRLSSSPTIIITDHHHHRPSSSPTIIITDLHHHRPSSSPTIIISDHHHHRPSSSSSSPIIIIITDHHHHHQPSSPIIIIIIISYWGLYCVDFSTVFGIFLPSDSREYTRL